jgi:hypothetical protein
MDTDDDDVWDAFHTFRTQAEADALLPEARAVVDEVTRRLPPGLVEIYPETLFVGRLVRQEVACFAASLSGIRYHLAPVEFELHQPFDETVERIVSSLLRWRERVESGEEP